MEHLLAIDHRADSATPPPSAAGGLQAGALRRASGTHG
jgi:hypothetical protein